MYDVEGVDSQDFQYDIEVYMNISRISFHVSITTLKVDIMNLGNVLLLIRHNINLYKINKQKQVINEMLNNWLVILGHLKIKRPKSIVVGYHAV